MATYATLVQLRADLKQTSGVGDDELQEVLDQAHEILDEALGIAFAEWDEASAGDVQAPGGAGQHLDLPAHQAGSVTAVLAVCGRGLSSETTEALTEYIEEEDGRLFYDLGWVPGAWYRVTAVWGYGPAPASAVRVELKIAANIWQGRGINTWQANAGADGGGAVAVNRALSWAERDMIEGIRTKYAGVLHA